MKTLRMESHPGFSGFNVIMQKQNMKPLSNPRGALWES